MKNEELGRTEARKIDADASAADLLAESKQVLVAVQRYLYIDWITGRDIREDVSIQPEPLASVTKMLEKLKGSSVS